MTTKLLALSLSVAMLSGIGIASADVAVLPGGLSEVATQSNVVRLTDKQMNEIVASARPTTKANKSKKTYTPGTDLVPDATFSPVVSEPTLISGGSVWQ